MTQTLLTSRNGSDLREYPVSEQKALKDYLEPRIVVYGYILNRNESFRSKFYNWGTQRIVPKSAR